MLVRANEINYDYTNDRVSAVGNVQIYYDGATLEADRVIYDQKTKRLHAEGNVRLDRAERPRHLRRDHQSQRRLPRRLRRFAAPRHARADPHRRAPAPTAAAATSPCFQSGVYTACEACTDDPRKPPKWQVKAARIIHDQGEQMIYFEDARLEFFGVPLAYIPYFSTPDPTAKRKTGFLIPTFGTSSLYGVRRHDALLLGAGAELRLHVHADDHHPAGSAAAGRVASSAAERLLHDPRVRHLPARPGCLRRHAGRSRLARRHQHDRPVPDQRPLGLGLGRHPHHRQDLLSGLRLLQIRVGTDLLRSTPDYVAVAGLSAGPRRSQLLRHARACISTASPASTTRSRSRSSIR